MANRIDFQIGYNVNQNDVNKVKASLKQLQNLTAKELPSSWNMNTDQVDAQLQQIKRSASQVEAALKKAFNTDLGSLNISKFNTELKKLNLDQIYKDFSAAGTAGQNAFRNVTAQILTTNLQLKQTHSFLNDMAVSMGNTIKWGVTSSIMNTFTGSIQEAWGYVKNLDTSLNDIRIVTGKSADEMDRFAEKANKVAQQLGSGTKDFTEASLIYYQQGLDDAEVAARAEVTLKAANVTGQTGEEVSEQLTAVWNGYKVTAEETELYVDKLAAVAATTASDLEELSKGMSKVASAANSMGVDVDQLNAQLSTIISVTRQAPESVGTALKTIYARMGDLAIDGEDEFGTTLGDVSGKMLQMGINVTDETGNLRDMGTVMEEVAAKWDTWTEAQKQAAAVAMAGKRQYNNLIALFDNWDMYTDALITSQRALGTLQEQQDIYLESTRAKLQQLGTAAEDVYDSLLDTNGINNVITGLTSIVSVIADIIDGLGGGKTLLLDLGAIAGKVFGKQIASSISTSITNIKSFFSNLKQSNAEIQLLQQFKGIHISDKATPQLIKMKQQMIDLGKVVTEEQQNEANTMMKATNELYNQQEAWEATKDSVYDYLRRLSALENNNYDPPKILDLDEKNNQEAEKAIEEQIESYKKARKEVQNYQAILSDFSELMKQVNELSEEENNNTQELENSKKALSDQQEELLGRGEALLQHLDTESEGYQKLKEAIAKVNRAISNASDEEQLEAFKEFIQVYRNENSELLQEAQRTLDIIHQANEGRGQEIQEAIDQSKQDFESFVSNLKVTQVVQGFVDLTDGIAQVAAGISNLTHLSEIWTNEDLSTGEKVVQILSAVAMGFSMLIGGVTSVITSVISLGTALGFTAPAFLLASSGATTLTVTIAGVQVALLPLIGTVALVVIGLTALAAIGVGVYNALHKNEIAAEKAAAANEKLAETCNNTKKAYDDLKQSITNYEDAQKAIDEMTKGTQEWKDAIAEANQQVIDLIQAYPGLAKEVKNVNGRLIIEDFSKVQEQLQNQVSETQQSLLRSNIHVNDTKNALLQDDIKEIYSNQLSNADWERAGVNKDTLAKLRQYSGQALIDDPSILTELSIHAATLGDDVVEAVNSIRELQTSIDANTQANDLYYQTLAQNELADNAIYQSSENKDVLAQMIGAKAEKTADDYKVLGLDSTIQEEYAKIMGWTRVKQTASGTGIYRTATGEQVEINDEEAKSQIALTRAMKDAEKSVKDFQQQINEVTKIGGSGFATVLTGNMDFSAMNKEELLKVAEMAEDQDNEILKGIAETLGISVEELVKQIQQGVVSASVESLDLQNTLRKPVQEAFHEIQADAEDLIDQKAIASVMSKAFAQGGQEGLDAATDILQKYGTDSGKVASIVESIDWSNPEEGMKQLNTLLQEQGLTVQGTQEQWLAFVNSLQGTKTEIDKVRESFLNLYNAIRAVQDIEVGDIVEEETYNKLIAANDEVAQFFVKTAEGYRYLGSQKPLSEYVQEDLDTVLKTVKEKSVEVQKALKTGFTFSDTMSTDELINQANKLEGTSFYDANLQEILSQIPNLDVSSDTYKTYVEDLKKALAEINAEIIYFGENGTAQSEATDEWIMQNISSLDELAKTFGTTSELYIKYKNIFINQDLEAAGIEQDLLEAYQKENNITKERAAHELILIENAKNLAGSLEENVKILKESEKGSVEYTNALSTLQPLIEAVFGVKWDAETIVANADKIKAALNGNIDAFNELRVVSKQEQINEIFNNIDTSKLEDAKSDFEKIKQMIDEGVGVLTIDGTVSQELINGLAAVLMTQGKSFDEINAIMNSLGYHTTGGLRADKIGSINSAGDYKYLTQQADAVEWLPKESDAQTIAENIGYISPDKDDDIKKTEKAKKDHKDIVEYEKQEVDLYKQINDETTYNNSQISALKDKNEDIKKQIEAIQQLGGDDAEERQVELINEYNNNLLRQHDLETRNLELIQSKIPLLEKEATTLRESLTSEGFEFDANTGLITNYMEAMSKAEEKVVAAQDEVNTKIKEYNDLVDKDDGSEQSEKLIKAKEEEIDVAQKAYDKAKEHFSDLKDDTSDYANLVSTEIPKACQDAQEAIDALDASDLAEEFLAAWQLDEVDRAMSQLDRQLKELKHTASHLEGKELINNLYKQMDIIDKQIEQQKKKIALKQQELKLLQIEIQLVLAKHNLEVQIQFDAEGNILNMIDVIKSAAEKMNEQQLTFLTTLINTYQSAQDAILSLQDEMQSMEWNKEDLGYDVQEEIERMQKEAEEARKKAEEEAQKAAEEAAKKAEEELNRRLKRFNLIIDVKLDLREARRQWNEYKHRVYGDTNDILANAQNKLKDFSTYYDNGNGSIELLTEHVNQIMAEVQTMWAGGASYLYGTDIEQALEDLDSYRGQLQDALSDIQDLYDEVRDSYQEMIDKISDKLSDQLSNYQQITNIIEHDMNLIKLLQGEDSYEELGKYYEKQEQNNNAELRFLKDQIAFWEAKMNSAEVGSEAWEKYQQNWKQAISELNSAVDSAVQNLIDKYHNIINDTFDKLNDKITGGLGLDYVGEEWDLINKNADRYLDKVNELYEIQKLENKFNDAINNTDSLKAQEKLTKVMEEQLNILKDKDKISQYDVDRANMIYDLTLKQIALEEAQQNKSQLRLRRDTQGNYSYQFVSDEDEIANARDELLEVQNSLFNLDKDKYRENLDEIYDIYGEFQEKLKELYADQTLTDEEREKQKTLLITQYQELINGIVADNEAIRQNLQESTFLNLSALTDMGIEEFWNMSEAEKEILMNEIIPQWDSGVQQMADTIAGEGGLSAACQDAFAELDQATIDYQQDLAELEEAAGVSFDAIIDGADENIDKIEELIETNDALIEQYMNELDAIEEVIASLEELVSAYQDAQAAAEEAVEAALELQEATAGALNPIASSGGGGSSGTTLSADTAIPSSKKPKSGSGGSNTSGSNKKKKNNNNEELEETEELPDPLWDDSNTINIDITDGKEPIQVNPNAYDSEKIAAAIWLHNKAGFGSGDTRKKRLNEVGANYSEVQSYLNNTDLTDNYGFWNAYGQDEDGKWKYDLSPWYYKQLKKFDTGGYTGEWGSNGRMAMLHEKELVLNKDDTQNILSAVDLVRQIVSSINNSMNQYANNLMNGIGMSETNNYNSSDNSVNQNVTIEAHFPNVSQSNEIEKAFENLVNIASQHAMNTRR